MDDLGLRVGVGVAEGRHPPRVGALPGQALPLFADQGVGQQGVQLEVVGDTLETHPEPAAGGAVQHQGRGDLVHPQQGGHLAELGQVRGELGGDGQQVAVHLGVLAHGRAHLRRTQHGLGGQAVAARGPPAQGRHRRGVAQDRGDPGLVGGGDLVGVGGWAVADLVPGVQEHARGPAGLTQQAQHLDAGGARLGAHLHQGAGDDGQVGLDSRTGVVSGEDRPQRLQGDLPFGDRNVGGELVDPAHRRAETLRVAQEGGVDQLLEGGTKSIDHLGIFPHFGHGTLTAPIGSRWHQPPACGGMRDGRLPRTAAHRSASRCSCSPSWLKIR